MINPTIVSVMVGKPRRLTPAGERSAIRKEPVSERVRVSGEGLSGDAHVYHAHGGSEKAILHCAREHYDTYRGRYPHLLVDIDGPRRGFGENISTSGMTEETVCIGDRYRIGSTSGITVEVSGFRQPCWKLGYNSGVRELPRIMQEDGTPGWYYRVLEEGTICGGDEISLLERPLPNWTVGEYTRRFYGTPLDRTFLEASLALPPLAHSLKSVVQTRLETGRVEDWNGRLYG